MGDVDAPNRPELHPPLRRRIGESDATLSVFFVLLLAGALAAGPLREAGAEWVIVALKLLTLAAGVAIVVGERGTLVAVVLAAVGVGVGHLTGGNDGALDLVFRVLFYAIVCAALLRRAFRSGRVTAHRILGAVSAYVVLAITWGTIYQLFLVLRPGAIQAGSTPASLDDAMWLSFVTLTTTGYGDVLPVAKVARSLAALEALVGVLYPAILIARLMSLVQTPSRGQ